MRPYKAEKDNYCSMNIAKGHVDTALVYWLIALTTSFSYLRDPALVPRGARANCVQTIKSFNWVITWLHEKSAYFEV